MTDATYDQAAIDAALAAPADQLPVYQAHQCQTGCGRLADAVLTQLDTSSVDILCNPCLMAMMFAVAQQLPDPAAVETVTPATDAI